MRAWRTSAAWLLALSLSSWPRSANAHADLDPLHDHRVLSLHLTDAGVVASYVLAFSATTSEELRREADTNRDGQLAEAEIAGLAARVAPLARGLRLDLDGAQLAFPAGAPTLEGALGEVAGPREIAARWEQRVWPTVPTEHRLVVADATKLARPGDLHVRISGEGQSRVLAVDHRVDARLSFLEAAFHRQDACQASTCQVAIRFSGGGLAPKTHAPLAWGIVVLALGIVPILVLVRRRQTPKNA